MKSTKTVLAVVLLLVSVSAGCGAESGACDHLTDEAYDLVVQVAEVVKATGSVTEQEQLAACIDFCFDDQGCELCCVAVTVLV